MPRIARKLLGNIFIHNMVQGINKEYIFQNDYQKNKYINLMREYSQKHKILIIAYCIMDNHAHLLTYSEDIENISLFMKDLNTKYATFYNKLNDRVRICFSKQILFKAYLQSRTIIKMYKIYTYESCKSQYIR